MSTDVGDGQRAPRSTLGDLKNIILIANDGCCRHFSRRHDVTEMGWVGRGGFAESVF